MDVDPDCLVVAVDSRRYVLGCTLLLCTNRVVVDAGSWVVSVRSSNNVVEVGI